jgi:hypothetical protein
MAPSMARRLNFRGFGPSPPHVRRSGDPVPSKAPTRRGARQLRDRGLRGAKAIIRRPAAYGAERRRSRPPPPRSGPWSEAPPGRTSDRRPSPASATSPPSRGRCPVPGSAAREVCDRRVAAPTACVAVALRRRTRPVAPPSVPAKGSRHRTVGSNSWGQRQCRVVAPE